jgi:predicted dehydrogenase
VMHIEAHFCNEHSTRVMGGWRDDPNESPGGGLTGAGLHLIDALVNLAGPIAQVDAKLFAQKPPPDPRDAAAVLVQFESGATGLLATVRAAPAYWRVHVFGTKGWAEARDETTITVGLVGQAPESQTLAPTDSLALLLESFAESIELATPFTVSTDDMLDVVGSFEAAIESIKVGKPVAVKR